MFGRYDKPRLHDCVCSITWVWWSLYLPQSCEGWVWPPKTLAVPPIPTYAPSSAHSRHKPLCRFVAYFILYLFLLAFRFFWSTPQLIDPSSFFFLLWSQQNTMNYKYKAQYTGPRVEPNHVVLVVPGGAFIFHDSGGVFSESIEREWKKREGEREKKRKR